MDNMKEIFNKWNPMEIHPLIEDEYLYEVRRISSEINSKSLTSIELANAIYTVFRDSFGVKFDKTLEECIEVAENILAK